MQMNQTLGWILLGIGISMLFVGIVFPMVTIIVDSSAPTWLVDSQGNTLLLPRNGETYTPIDKLQAGVADPESGVSKVTAKLDGVTYSLNLVGGTIYSGTWLVALPSPLTTSGTHTIIFTAENYAGLIQGYSGSFKIYVGLQGDWYLNGHKIASSTDIIYLTDATVTFKFAKTSGVEDSKITCFVEEASTILVTLPYTASGTWSGSYTFSQGKHNLNLKAYDGTQTVMMSVLGLQIGSELPQLNTLQILGLASTGIGLLLIFTGRRKSGGG